MKYIFVAILTTFFAGGAQALPVMNENVANSGVLVVYPDHQDPHRYYISPNVVVIAKNSKGVPHFSYSEYRQRLFTKVGVLTMTMVPAYSQEDLEAVKNAILQKDPEAQFSGIAFVGSSLALNGVLPELISSSKCDHAAGVVGQEQSCSFVLTPKGRTFFLKAVEHQALFITLNFEYNVQAVLRQADGSFQDARILFGVAARIDGAQLARHPQLIRRL